MESCTEGWSRGRRDGAVDRRSHGVKEPYINGVIHGEPCTGSHTRSHARGDHTRSHTRGVIHGVMHGEIIHGVMHGESYAGSHTRGVIRGEPYAGSHTRRHTRSHSIHGGESYTEAWTDGVMGDVGESTHVRLNCPKVMSFWTCVELLQISKFV